jgi:hypothetical protein
MLQFPKKTVPGAARAGKRRFFSVVGADRGNDWQVCRMAVPGFPFKAVGAALPRADIAGGKPGFERFHPVFQFAGAVEGQISRLERRVSRYHRLIPAEW